MRIPTRTSPTHPLSYGSGDNEVARLQSRLPPLLSVVAGMVDVISYLSLGKLFTAHVTGNVVVIAALLVRGGPPNIDQVLAVPVFAIAVGGVWLAAKASGRRGPALVRPLLLVQFLLLVCVMIFGVISSPSANPQGLVAGVAAMIAVSAMACQFALLRLALPGAPSTGVMTGNLTNTVLSLMDSLSPGEPLTSGASDRLKRTLKVVIGFFLGCVAGAGAVSWLADRAWSLPVVLAGAAVMAVPGRPKGSDTTNVVARNPSIS